MQNPDKSGMFVCLFVIYLASDMYKNKQDTN